MRSVRPKTQQFIAVVLLCGVGAPFSSRAQIPKTVDEPYAAPPDRAVVVFTRPRHRQASETPFRVIDQSGRCISLLENGWQTATPVWPGKRMLMVVAGSAQPTVQLVEAKLGAGKTYVVKLRARVNVKSPVDIEVIRRSKQPLEAFPPTIKEQSPFAQDLRRCTEWVRWKQTKIEPKAEKAKLRWDEATEEYRDEHTIRRNDGWTAAEVAGP